MINPSTLFSLFVKDVSSNANIHLHLKDKSLELAKQLNQTQFLRILEEINLFYTVELLKGNKIDLGSGNGTMEIISKTITTSDKRINWGASNKLKQQIIDAGLEPYKNEDELLSKSLHIPYKGVRWHIYNGDAHVPYIVWNSPPYLKSLYLVTFNRAKNNDITMNNMSTSLTKDDIIYHNKLGIARKLKLLLANDKNYIMKFIR